ncbi:class I SAM-dependent methyltransferase [Elongatibacter sediminis]|uniref:Class I SAM-dependent methyltransferase n=1 Tax=Elongatibacter sediminis TaxID=3119006 RepID=A0AAW9RDV5_9GAMM
MALMRKKKKMADLADPHDLYQRSVQDTEAEIDFVLETWNALRDRPAGVLREDFCGTANTACEWVRRSEDHYAIGVDIDGDVLDWGVRHNLTTLDADESERIDLLQGDVLEADCGAADIVLAMNFSYWLFRSRPELLAYFRSVFDGLSEDGIFVLDAYGGYDAPREIEESRECDGFTYIWDQADFNPIDSGMTCHIHFEFPDGSRMDRAFSYQWRLWTLPEIRELLLEAGFVSAEVYWEGTDEDSNEGNGIYEPSEVGDADAGWICYLVAQR